MRWFDIPIPKTKTRPLEWDGFSFHALAVFVKRPQAEYQIGATTTLAG
jgi:hypothetical protein